MRIAAVSTMSMLATSLAQSPLFAQQVAQQVAQQDSQPAHISEKGNSDWIPGLRLGSYGRIDAGSDFEGGSPQSSNVVAHGSRIVQPTYLELDLYYRLAENRGVRLTTVTTLAFGNDLFHFDGEFDSSLALRNFFVQAERDELGVWAGSRMVRGDDIYLLDFWPLDDLNTVGAGAWLRRGTLEFAANVGVNRLLDAFQFQEREVMGVDQVGAQTIAQLNRQRFVGSLKSTLTMPKLRGELGIKAALYGEVHALPSGERRTQDQIIEDLPSDAGWTVGGQLTAWGLPSEDSHATLFVRYSKGLAAFDELAVPTGLSAKRRAYPASEFLVGWTGNLEAFDSRLGLMAGGYSKRFVDADRNQFDRDDGWEYSVNARPWANLIGDVGAALDVSFQARLPRGISPTTLTAMDPAVFQIAPMLLYSPFGRGAFARPQFRLVYRAAHQNEGARDLFPVQDSRHNKEWMHYGGIQAEWWFNSSYR